MDSSSSQPSRGDQNGNQELVFAELFRILKPILSNITRPTAISFRPDGSFQSNRRLFVVARLGAGVEILVDEGGCWFRGVDFRNGILIVKSVTPKELVQWASYEGLYSGLIQNLDLVIERRKSVIINLTNRRDRIDRLLTVERGIVNKTDQP